MAGLTSQVFRAGLSALHLSGVSRVLRPVAGGKGAVLMLHRVQPATQAAFAPNATLSVTPRYLDALVASFRRAKIDIVTLDEARARIVSEGRMRRFVCFTFDDGYRDNLEHALPVFQRYGAPFTVYATTSFIDRSFAPWWAVLERVVAESRHVRLFHGSAERRYECTDLASKQRAFAGLSNTFFESRSAQMRAQVAQLAADFGVAVSELAAQDICSVDELRALHAGGAEIGCHTISHPVLMRESLDVVQRELREARSTLEGWLGCTVKHLAYPYGKREHVGAREFAAARELGFATATTTRKGALFPAHAEHLHALPRVEVSPNFESSPRYLHTILNGVPLALWNHGRLAVTD